MNCCNGPGFNPVINRWFPYFAGFTAFTPTIPKMYFDVDSVEQRYFILCKQLHKLICYVDFMGDKVNITKEEIDDLKAQFQAFMEHGFDDYYAAQIEAWINEHMADILAQSVKQVYFGLTEDGHFCAYIPESWNDIVFDTGMVYGRCDYGRLILRFDSDGAIDNTYSYSLAQGTKLETLIADLETNIKRTDASFDTLFTTLDEEVIINGNI